MTKLSIKKLIRMFSSQTELHEVGKEGQKSIMELGQKTVFDLKDIIKLLNEYDTKV